MANAFSHITEVMQRLNSKLLAVVRALEVISQAQRPVLVATCIYEAAIVQANGQYASEAVARGAHGGVLRWHVHRIAGDVEGGVHGLIEPATVVGIGIARHQHLGAPIHV